MFLTTVLAVSVCGWGPAPDPELVSLYESAHTFEEFVATASARQEMWATNGTEATIPEAIIYQTLELEGSYRFLVVAADRCQDSAWSIPFLAALAEVAPNLELRMVRPGEGGQAVMDARPTPDGRAATPTVLILNEAGDEVGCWIERPTRQREFYDANIKGVDRSTEEFQVAVRDFLGWYAEDRGQTMLGEVLELLRQAESGAAGCAAVQGSPS